MDKEQKDIELVESYIKGNMSDEEVKEIKQRLESDLEFQQLYDDIVLISKQTRINALTDTANHLKNLSQELGPVPLKRPFNFNLFFFILLILLGLLFFGYKYLNPEENKNPVAEALFEENFDVKKYYAINKSSKSDIIALEKSTIQYYSLEKYDKSADGFEELFESINDTTYLYYAAISNLAENKLKKAQEQFLNCKNASDIDQGELENYIWLAKLRGGDIEGYKRYKEK